jgi:hypothetical protein
MIHKFFSGICNKAVKMAAANFDAKHIFGLKPGVAGNVCYHDEQTIVSGRLGYWSVDLWSLLMLEP